jgi:hypothetical protein
MVYGWQWDGFQEVLKAAGGVGLPLEPRSPPWIPYAAGGTQPGLGRASEKPLRRRGWRNLLVLRTRRLLPVERQVASRGSGGDVLKRDARASASAGALFV